MRWVSNNYFCKGLKKKLFFITLAMAIIAVAAVIITDDSDDSDASSTFDVNGIKYETISDTEVKVVSNSYSGSIEIPSVVSYVDKEYSVKSIDDLAFYECTSLTTVIIPDSVTSIGEYAFDCCTSLTSATIGSSVVSIGNFAFFGCSSMISIIIPDSVTSIGSYAFSECTSLTLIVLSDGVTSIGSQSFGLGTSDHPVECDVCGCTDKMLDPYADSHTIFTYCKSSTVTYNENGGTVSIDPEIVLVQCTLKDYDGAKDKCIFVGWTDGKEIYDAGSSVRVLDDTTFYAVWERTDEMQFKASIEGASVTCKVITEPAGELEGTVEISWVTSASGAVTIPSAVSNKGDDYRVISIGDSTFGGFALTSIVIPDSVVSIGKRAFSGCTSLAFVTIGSNVTSISDYAFYGCILLASIVIPNSVTSIGKYAFSGCTSLAFATIGNGVTSIGESTFEGCTSLASVTIGNSVASIGEWAFRKCTSLISIVIPNSVTSIGNYAFSGCTSLASVTIGSSVTSIGKWVFNECTSLTSIVIPNSVTSISERTFDGCTSLASVTIGSNVTSIGDYAFYGCISLASIVIPNSVTSIGKYAFSGCTSLAFATIGNGVTSIGESTFEGCTSLASVTIGSNVTSIGKWVFNECTSLTSIVIPNSVTSIGKYAFSGCTSLASVTIGNSVASIGEWAFSKCTSLTIIIIPNSVTSTGEYVFDCCTSLTSVKIGSGITSISNHAFGGCVSLTSVTIGSNVTSIGNHAFNGCKSLASIVIPDSVTSIGNYAFYGCISLISVVIPNSVTSIGEWTFSGCTPLASVTIGNSVTSIGNYAFYECTSLASIVIPDSVTSIGNYAFYGCISLLSVTIGSNVVSIGGNAFNGCKCLREVCNDSSLDIIKGSTSNGYVAYYALNVYSSSEGSSKLHYQTLSDSSVAVYYQDDIVTYLIKVNGMRDIVVLPDTLGGSSYEIYNDTFNGCTSLESVTIGSSVTSIGNNAFDGCTSLASVTVPDRVISICKNAFYGCTSLESVIIGSSVTSIDTCAFYRCVSLKTVINNSLLDIKKGSVDHGYVAYYADVVIGSVNDYQSGDIDGKYNDRSKVANITRYNGSLKSLVLDKVIIDETEYAVVSICSNAFKDCESLISITIPDSVISIGESVFCGCSSLEEIVVTSGNTEYSSVDGVLFDNDVTVLICYPSGRTNETYLIPSTVTSISDNAFSGCSYIICVDIPDSVISIGTSAFYKCTSMELLMVSDDVSVSEDAFNMGTSEDPSICYVTGCSDGKMDGYKDENTTFIYGTYYMIQYDVDGGSVPVDPEIVSGSLVLKDYSGVKEGYAFAGWHDGKDVCGAGKTVTITGNTIFTAVWNTVYAIEYDVNGGNGTPTGGTEFASYGTLLTMPDISDVKRTGYIFAGWSFDRKTVSDDMVLKEPQIDAAIGTTVTLYALWTPGTYHVKVVCMTGSERSEEAFDMSGPFSFNISPLGTITYSDLEHTSETMFDAANWDVQHSFRTIAYAGKSLTSDETVSIDDDIADGCTFDIICTFEKIYTISYDMNGGKGVIGEGTTSVKVGDTFVLPEVTDALKDGYIYAGWSYDRTELYDNSAGQFSDDLASAANDHVLVMYALWINTCVVTFDPESNMVKSAPSGWDLDTDRKYYTMTVDIGAVIEDPGFVIEKDSTAEYTYTFDGWCDTDGNIVSFPITVSSEMKFYAVFKETLRNYTVTYISDGVVKKQSVMEYGSTITEPETDPIRASTAQYDYLFSNWDGFTEGMTVTGEVTFTAVFDELLRSYNISFVSDGKIQNSEEMKYGSVITKPIADPVRDPVSECEFIFSNWDGFTEGMTVTGKAVFTAVFYAAIKKIDTSGEKAIVNIENVDDAKASVEIIDKIKAAGAQGKDTEISLSKGKIILDGASAAGLPSGELTISMQEADRSKIPAKLLDSIGNRPVFSINMGDIHEFNGKLTISLKYTLADGEDPDKICIWYLTDSGSYEKISCKYSDGYVTFITTHLSNYAVMTDDSVTASPSESDSSDNGGTGIGLIIGGVVAGIAVIAIVAFVILRPKH